MFNTNDITEMKDFMLLMNNYVNDITPINEEIAITEHTEEEKVNNNDIINDLKVLIEKLRSHAENVDDDNDQQALGVEIGMQRSADMIENLINNISRKE